MNFAIATPHGYEPNEEIVAQADGLAAVTGAELLITNDPAAAAQGAHAIYTDVWASMGAGERSAERRTAFARLPGGRRALPHAEPGCGFHALPAGASAAKK